jgi:hypothetical protein
MNQEDNKELKLLRIKVKYLEDRINVLEMCVSRINKILGRFQMTENQEQGFKDIGELYQEDNGHELI